MLLPLGQRFSHLATPRDQPGGLHPWSCPGPRGRGGFGAPQVMLMAAHGAGGDDFNTFYDPVLSPQRPLPAVQVSLWILDHSFPSDTTGPRDSRSDYPFPQCSLPLSLQTALDRVDCH